MALSRIPPDDALVTKIQFKSHTYENWELKNAVKPLESYQLHLKLELLKKSSLR